MSNWQTIADIRREYGELSLNEKDCPDSPIKQFEAWFEEVLKSEKSDPTAMVLSTADGEGRPDSRVVLLKAIEDGAFLFYTNYESVKANQIKENPYAALNFYWPQMARQVRIRGRIEQISAKQSDEYFSSRPVKSQYSAVASPQSQQIADRKELELKITKLIEEHGQKPLLRPKNWGGFKLLTEEMEFWQGRDNRLHDRIQYLKRHEQWQKRRLAP